MEFEEAYYKTIGWNGWMSKEDCRVLFDYASSVKNGLIVEIGSYAGISTAMLALGSPTSKIVSIDPYLGFEEIYHEFLRNTNGIKIEQIKERSQVVGKTWNRPIDLLHIDGDHSYGAVLEDMQLFFPHLKEDGIMLLHDIDVPHFGVGKALCRFIMKSGLGVLKK